MTQFGVIILITGLIVAVGGMLAFSTELLIGGIIGALAGTVIAVAGVTFNEFPPGGRE